MAEAKDDFSRGLSDTELIAFVEGRLDEADACRIAEAVAASSELQREVRLIQSILESAKDEPLRNPPGYFIERTMAAFRRLRAHSGHEPKAASAIRHIIARLLFDSRREPALAGMRGGSHRRHLTYGSDLGRVDLQISRPGREPQRLIRGQFVPAPDAFDVVVRHSAMGDPVSRAQADERGGFRFSVEPGQYDLVLQLGKNVLLVPDLPVT